MMPMYFSVSMTSNNSTILGWRSIYCMWGGEEEELDIVGFELSLLVVLFTRNTDISLSTLVIREVESILSFLMSLIAT